VEIDGITGKIRVDKVEVIANSTERTMRARYNGTKVS